MAHRVTTYNKRGQLETRTTAPHIKPSHRGRLRAKLGKITAAKLQKAKHSKNPATRKQATFALNARKWKH